MYDNEFRLIILLLGFFIILYIVFSTKNNRKYKVYKTRNYDIKKPIEVNSITLALGSSAITILILLPVVFYFELFIDIKYPFQKIEFSIIALGLITAVAYTLFIYLITNAGAVFASNVGYVVTISGVIWGIVLFQETHSYWVWLSLITMIIGLSLVSPRRKKKY